MKSIAVALRQGILAVALLLPLPSYAGVPFQYLIDAANQIKQVEYSKTILGDDDNGRIAKIACDALKRLADDNEFKTALSDIFEKNGAKKGEAAALAEKLSEFNSIFLTAELSYLQAAGLDYPADPLQIASRWRSKANLKDVSPTTVLQTIADARDKVCAFAASILTQRQRRATQVTFGGVTLIVVDVAAAIGIGAASGGTLAVASGAVIVSSIGIGASAAVAGVKGDIP